MSYSTVLALINAEIVANGNNEITADVLRPILQEMLLQPNELIGLLSELETSDQTSLVNAINSILSENLPNATALRLIDTTGIDTDQDELLWVRDAINQTALNNGAFTCALGQQMVFFCDVLLMTTESDFVIQRRYYRLTTGATVDNSLGTGDSPPLMQDGVENKTVSLSGDLVIDLGNIGTDDVQDAFNSDPNEPFTISGDKFIQAVQNGDNKLWQWIGGNGTFGDSATLAVATDFVDLTDGGGLPPSILAYNKFVVKSKDTSTFISSAPGEINARYSGSYITEFTFSSSFSKFIADGIAHTSTQKIVVINLTQEIISKALVTLIEYTDVTDTYYKCLVDEGILEANINNGDVLLIEFDEIGDAVAPDFDNVDDSGYVPTNYTNINDKLYGHIEGIDIALGTIGTGDMLKSVYDPTNINASAFDRANHTGTQLASTISDFASSVISAAASTYQAILTATNFGAFIVGLTSKTTPVDADSISVVDSEASNVQKKVSLTNFKAFLKTYFDGLYQAKPVFTADTGTVISLAYTAGNVCNTGTANTNGTFTLTGTVSGGNAVVLINRATEPTVTGATLIKGSTFIASTNMYLKVWNNGTVTQYWFE
ncbi:MAG: hypothetical protein KDD03_13030, partial [Gelidibacter sp.]|nr:hypothetical protein [Gelidibacter sp.]